MYLCRMILTEMFSIVSQVSLVLLHLQISLHFSTTLVWSRPQISSHNEEYNNKTISPAPSEMVTTNSITGRNENTTMATFRPHASSDLEGNLSLVDGTFLSSSTQTMLENEILLSEVRQESMARTQSMTDRQIPLVSIKGRDKSFRGTGFSQNVSHSAVLFCSLAGGNGVFSAISDNAGLDSSHDRSHMAASNLTMFFFDRCPSGYEDTTVTRQCEILLNGESTPQLIHILPVISYFEGVTLMFKNVFCAFCHNLTSYSHLSLTLSCPEEEVLGVDTEVQYLHRVIRQCGASLSVNTSFGRVVFPFNLTASPSSLTDKDSRNRTDTIYSTPCQTQARSCVKSNICARCSLQIYNCAQKVVVNGESISQPAIEDLDLKTSTHSLETAQKASDLTNMNTDMEVHLTSKAPISGMMGSNIKAPEIHRTKLRQPKEAQFGGNANNRTEPLFNSDENANNRTTVVSGGDGNTNNQGVLTSPTQMENHAERMEKSKNKIEVLTNHLQSPKNNFVVQSGKTKSFDNQSTMTKIGTELVLTMVDYEDDTLLSTEGVTCTGNQSRIPAVCMRVDWRFSGLRQWWTLTCLNSDLDASHKTIFEIKSLLSTFKPEVVTTWWLESKETTVTSQILIRYDSLINPRVLLETLVEMNMDSFPNCSIDSLSKLSTCEEGTKVAEDNIFNSFNKSGLLKTSKLFAFDRRPCPFDSQTESGGLLDLSRLGCFAKVQVTKEEFEKLKKSPDFQTVVHQHIVDEGKVWICAHLVQGNKNGVISKKGENVDWGQTWTTVICTSISLTSLAMTLIFKAASQKIYSLPVKLMMNLMVSLFISQSLLLLMAIDNRTWCTCVSVMSHYCWLSTFCWMFICAVHMYKTFYRNSAFTTLGNLDAKHCLVVYTIAGYGSPLLIVIPSVLIDFCACVGVDISIGYGREVCFINEPIANIATFAGPTALILFLNLILFACTFLQIKRTSDAVESVQSARINTYRIFLKISSLFGFTWIFGYIAMLTNSDVIWYIFSILNSLQGLHIFIAFGIRDGKVVFCRMISMIPVLRGEPAGNTTMSGCSPEHVPKGYSAQTLSGSIGDCSTRMENVTRL